MLLFKYPMSHFGRRNSLPQQPQLDSSHLCGVFCQLGHSGRKQQEGLLTSDSHRPNCFSKKCFDMAYCGARHQQANHAKLAAYMDEKPENAVKRKG